MTTDYRDHAMYQEAMRAYGQEVFATWLCERYPWGGVDLAWARAQWLVEDLADFRQYPPGGENDHETNCFLCSLPVARSPSACATASSWRPAPGDRRRARIAWPQPGGADSGRLAG